MQNVFDEAVRRSLLERLDRLQPASPRRWGKMDPAQMMAHCSAVLETATGQTPRRQSLLGKLVTPFIRKMVLGEKPFQKGAPTDPTFVVPDERDFAAEKARLAGLVEALCRRGPGEAAKNPHVFFGKLSGEEWGVLTFKHLDHHLRQFGV